MSKISELTAELDDTKRALEISCDQRNKVQKDLSQTRAALYAQLNYVRRADQQIQALLDALVLATGHKSNHDPAVDALKRA